MNKKQLLILTGVGLTVYALLSKKKEKFSADELEKINKYKQYLEDKDFVIVDKKKYKKMNKSGLLSISAIPNYYSVAKTIAKYIM